MKIIIPGIPISKTRHKCSCRHGRSFAYDPQVSKEMNMVRNQILKSWNDAFDSENKIRVLEASELTKVESFMVSFTFVFPYNKSDSLAQKNAKLWGLIPYACKPDLDNLEKFYLDCATGVIWDDDAKVSLCQSRKMYGESPYTEIDIVSNKPMKFNQKIEKVLTLFTPEKFIDLINDIKKMDEIPLIDNLLDLECNSYKETILNSLAIELINFSNKYSTYINKISKMEIINELETNF